MFKIKINILGMDYTVTKIPEISDVNVHKDCTVYGQCDIPSQGIRVYAGENVADDCSLESVLHETIHCILSELGYLEQDERLVSMLSTGLYQMFKANRFFSNTWYNLLKQSQRDKKQVMDIQLETSNEG